MEGRRRNRWPESVELNTSSRYKSKNKNRMTRDQKMITYIRVEVKSGEELCYITDPTVQIPEGLNVYDEVLKRWVIGIPWDTDEHKWLKTHTKAIQEKPILERDETLRENETKYILKYKTVDKKVRPVAMTIPEEMKVKRTFPRDPLANLPPLPQYAPDFTPTKKMTKERMEKLEEDMNNELSPEEKQLLKYIITLNERSVAFEDEERGTFRRDYFSDYKIPVIPHTPWADKNIPLPKGYIDEIIRMLKERINAGVYEETQSSYRSRWFCVKKKNGGLRMVHDLQKLNKITMKDSGVPPILEEFVEAYAGRSIYSVLDMYWGFYARVMDPSSRDMTAFQTPIGPLRIVSLPMGFTNSPAEFQACMTFILQDEIPEVAGVFIDDIPIKGPETRYEREDGTEETILENPGIRRFVWEHLRDLHRILHRIGEAGGTVSGKKMQLCKFNVEIVGQKCSSKGREPTDSKIQKILKWPRPQNVTQVRGFLGLCGTVRIWIQDYSQIAKPLIDLTRKEAEFLWGESQEEAFERLKVLITSAPALRPIDYRCDRTVTLSVDSSIYGIGFVLSQEDELGRKVPARYGSLPVTPVQANYAQSKLELYGLMRALWHYRIFIVGVKNLVVEVDCASIKGMLNKPDVQASTHINRWIDAILMFDFKLVHVPGERHKGPDALSRRGFSPEEMEEGLQPVVWIDDMTLLATYKKPIRTKERIKVWTTLKDNQEGELVQILEFLVTLKLPDGLTHTKAKIFAQKAARFYVQGLAMYRRQKNRPDQKVIFPEERRREILEQLHEGIGHRGEWAVWEALRIRFYWPRMRNDLTEHIKSCHNCQLRSTKKMHIPIQPSLPKGLFQKVYLDVMKMPEAQGKSWIVACRDDLSGVTEGRAIASDNAKTLAKFFKEQIIYRYGTVEEVVTDNGPSMMGEFAQIIKKFNIHQIKISAYNSQANGVVERGHYNLREAIVKMCNGKMNEWPNVLQAAIYADRITVRRATGYSPFYLLHGTHPMLPCDLAETTFMVRGFTKGMSEIELLIARIRQLMKLPRDVENAAKLLEKSRLKSKEAFEQKFGRRLNREGFKPGELVLLRNNTVEDSVSTHRKVTDRYMGPYEIIRKRQGGSYELAELSGAPLRTSVAAFRLIPYIRRSDLMHT